MKGVREMEQKGICYIVGAGDFDVDRFVPKKEDYIIAADAGLVYVEEAGYTPDLIVGDFDSLGYIPQGKNILKHPVEKDDTDLALAAKTALEKGYYRLYLFGATGGRLDHTLANLQMVTGLCREKAEVFCFCPDCTIAALSEGSLDFTGEYRGTVSVFSAGDKAEQVDLEGLKYSLKNARLDGFHTLGVSNEFTGVPARIHTGSGVLWIIWQENHNIPLPVFTADE